MFEGFTSAQIDVGGGIAIHAKMGGAGPPVLLLHGFPQTLAMWAAIAPRIAERYTVVVADLRGYGDSSKPKSASDNANYAFRALAADQVAVMRHFGFPRFHVIGHDRGGRTAHRMALDFPSAVVSVAMLDIVPTAAMFLDTNRHVAGAYWHWYFLSQPSPFPEHMIGLDADFFFETCLVGWGAAKITDFNAEQLAEYRRCWRDPEMIHAACSDYRAAATVDLAHDLADLDRRIACPALALWGSSGVMHKLFDMRGEWQKRCARLTCDVLPGGHFFADQLPRETAARLLTFLDEQGGGA